MHFAYTTLFYVAAHLALVNAVALPVARDVAAQQQHQARAGGGIVDILKDHGKYVANPPSAEEPIPDAENSELRETHRQAHKTIFEVMSGAGGAGAGKDKDGKDKGGNDKDGKDKGGKDKGAAPANDAEEAAAA